MIIYILGAIILLYCAVSVISGFTASKMIHERDVRRD